jgi:hypothetical protein
MAERNTSSWAARAALIASASASHRRVEPSTSVNKNVTAPDGGPALTADTQAECHTEHGPIANIGIRPQNIPITEERDFAQDALLGRPNFKVV